MTPRKSVPAVPQVAGLMYHDVTDQPDSSGFLRSGARPYKLALSAFEDHLDAIAEAPTAPSLVTAVDFGRPGRHVVLTFDDGGKSALTASEALARRGWKAHFFIVTSRIGQRTFLTATEVRELAAYGHSVGSHSHTHPDIFRDLSVDQMRQEWRISRDAIAQLLGAPCVTASVPGGDISRLVIRSAAEIGYAYLFTSDPRVEPQRVPGCWVLGRFAAKRDTSPARVRELTRFRGWRSALLARRLKNTARASLPFLYRARVRAASREPAEVQ
jgi:peptidoglycan/xylan/chitin deacetylase (PgdA/CDA1 family)